MQRTMSYSSDSVRLVSHLQDDKNDGIYGGFNRLKDINSAALLSKGKEG